MPVFLQIWDHLQK